MNISKKIISICISFVLMICSFCVSITAVFAWFNGKGYSGKTMAYDKHLYIGTTNSEVTNYYGYMDYAENFIYTQIDPILGFEYNNLIPGSYLFLRTDISNISQAADMIISLYLQNMSYDEELNSYLYIGTNNPIMYTEPCQNISTYDSVNEEYDIESVSLLSNYTIPEGETLSLYWYIHIDSDATLAVANASINLGNIALAFNS